jgi:DNA-binding NarL/FixJ family response regulator
MNNLSADRIKVGILHAEPLMAAGLIHSLGGEADFDLSTDAGEWNAANVVVTDLSTGLRLAKEIRVNLKDSTHARLLVVTAHDREYEVRRAMESGIHGYILASCDALELVRSVRVVGRGARYLSTTVASRIADNMTHEALTARESDVLTLLARGQCNKSIAKNLAISLGTVKVHVKAIMAKLQATSRTHAVSVALTRGLVHDEAASPH